MTRYRKSASRATEGQKQEKVACSPAWFTVLIAEQKCATATSYFEKRQDHFVCASYRSNTGTCSAHFIRAVVLEELVDAHENGYLLCNLA